MSHFSVGHVVFHCPGIAGGHAHKGGVLVEVYLRFTRLWCSDGCRSKAATLTTALQCLEGDDPCIWCRHDARHRFRFQLSWLLQTLPPQAYRNFVAQHPDGWISRYSIDVMPKGRLFSLGQKQVDTRKPWQARQR